MNEYPKPDIINYIISYEMSSGNSKESVTAFLSDVQKRYLEYTTGDCNGKQIILYSGCYQESACHEIVKKIDDKDCLMVGKSDTGHYFSYSQYINAISDKLKKKGVSQEEITKILHNKSYDVSRPRGKRVGARLPDSKIGYGDLKCFDDFISEQFVAQAYNVKENLIVFIPEGVDKKSSFATSEFDAVMKNPNLKYINGIPKDVFEEQIRIHGRDCPTLYEPIVFAAKMAMEKGDQTLSSAERLSKAVNEGSLNPKHFNAKELSTYMNHSQQKNKQQKQQKYRQSGSKMRI